MLVGPADMARRKVGDDGAIMERKKVKIREQPMSNACALKVFTKFLHILDRLPGNSNAPTSNPSPSLQPEPVYKCVIQSARLSKSRGERLNMFIIM